MPRFAAPPDRALRIATALSLAVMAAGLVALGWAFRGENGPGQGFLLVAGAAIASAAALAWALAPTGFAVEGGAIHVERWLRPIRIPLAEVRAVAPLPPGALRGALRLGGSGGLFGYYGRFRSGQLGSFRLYARRRDGLVLLDTAAERWVLAPEPAARFVEEVRARAGLAPAAGAELLPPPRPMGRGTKLALAALLALVPAAIAAVLLASYAFAPVGARVEPGAVVVERRWAGPAELPLAGIRAASLLPPGALRGLRRTGGVALGETAYGRFRSEALGSFQLYAWRRGPAVLLETESGRVVLTPDDPARFAAEVAARLGER